MKYSVIVPVYNVEAYLDRCVSSILSQSFTDYELILVDDGSPDACPAMCDAWGQKDKRVRVVHRKNGGLSAARNSGLDIAKGDYILFVDSDDFVCEDFFEKMEQLDLPNGWLIYTSYILRSSSKRIRFVRATDDKSRYFDTLQYLIDSRTLNNVYPKKYSRTVINRCCLRFEDMVPAEDFIFSLRYALNCDKIVVRNDAIYVYERGNENSITSARKYGLIDIYPHIFDRAFDLVRESALDSMEKETLFRSLDKLHTDSFATCVMEELKDKEASLSEILKRIRILCSKFYSQYPSAYGYKTLTHFCVRFCIRFRLALPLFCFGKLYMKTRK